MNSYLLGTILGNLNKNEELPSATWPSGTISKNLSFVCGSQKAAFKDMPKLVLVNNVKISVSNVLRNLPHTWNVMFEIKLG